MRPSQRIPEAGECRVYVKYTAWPNRLSSYFFPSSLFSFLFLSLFFIFVFPGILFSAKTGWWILVQNGLGFWCGMSIRYAPPTSAAGTGPKGSGADNGMIVLYGDFQDVLI